MLEILGIIMVVGLIIVIMHDVETQPRIETTDKRSPRERADCERLTRLLQDREQD